MNQFKLSTNLIIRLTQFVLGFAHFSLIYFGYFHWSMSLLFLMILAFSLLSLIKNDDASMVISSILSITAILSFELVIVFLKSVAGGSGDLRGIVIYSIIQAGLILLSSIIFDIGVVYQHKYKNSKLQNQVIYGVVIISLTCVSAIIALFHLGGFNDLSVYLILLPLLFATSPSYLFVIFYFITKKYPTYKKQLIIIFLSVYILSLIVFHFILPLYVNILFD